MIELHYNDISFLMLWIELQVYFKCNWLHYWLHL